MDTVSSTCVIQGKETRVLLKGRCTRCLSNLSVVSRMRFHGGRRDGGRRISRLSGTKCNGTSARSAARTTG